MKTVFVVVLLAIATKPSNCQLRCYTCSFSSVDTDRSCLNIGSSSPSVECNMRYCVIVRQEFVDPAGTIASFLRGCDDSPDYLNHEVVDSSFRTYYRACTTDLCNVGNGVESVVGGNLEANPYGTGQNLLVPGTGAAYTLSLNLAVLLFGVLLFIV